MVFLALPSKIGLTLFVLGRPSKPRQVQPTVADVGSIAGILLAFFRKALLMLMPPED